MVGVDASTWQVPVVKRRATLARLHDRPGFELYRLDLATAEIEPLLEGAAGESACTRPWS